MWKLVLILLLCASAFKKAYAQNGIDTINIYFDLGTSGLTHLAKHTIDSLLYHDVLASGRKVGIIGYADNIGGAQANQKLSADRAQSVRSYLLKMQVDPRDVEWVTANGEVSRPENGSGYPADRKVGIIPGGFKKIKLGAGQKKLGDIIRYVNDTPVIDIDQVAVNSIFKLDKVYFSLGKSDLLKQSIPMLNALYTLMRDNPTLKIQIEGHVCCAPPYIIVEGKREPIPEGQTDTAAFTRLEDLSVYRSAAVFWYLKNKGIDKSRIRYIGYGTKRMLVKQEVTEEDRAANRRVEIRIVSK